MKLIAKLGAFVALLVVAVLIALSGPGQAIGAALIGRPQLTADIKVDLDTVKTYKGVATPNQVITNIGGPIKTQGTVLVGIDLTGFSGEFDIVVSGQVDRTTVAATPGMGTQPQLALWTDCDNDGVFEWNTSLPGAPETSEGPMSPNATIPDEANRHVTVAGFGTAKLWKACHTKLVAHGYSKGGSGAGSGELTVRNATVVLTPTR